jgi:hypothetical protein
MMRTWVSSTWMVDDFAGVGGSDAESPAGDHDDAAAGFSRWTVTGPGVGAAAADLGTDLEPVCQRCPTRSLIP